MERSSKGLLVLPIFYHINPSDVRKLDGNFKNSFDSHGNKPADEVKRWKNAFAKVGEKSGWHISGNSTEKSEPEYIREIIQVVTKELRSNSSSGSKEFVGIDAHKEEILKLIHQNENETTVIGICGMGGIGKTTLGKAVYKEVSCKFVDNSFFLLNVREKFEKQEMESVVKDFVGKILNQDGKTIDIPLSDVIIERLLNKTVFVVLDDVNDSDQIEDLGVQHLGGGSKIIVTSRDKQVLRNSDAEIWELTPLNDDDSLKLISRFAFKQDHPAADFRDISIELANCARGLPLALKLLGSALYKKPKEDWQSSIVNLKKSPEERVFNTLKISFDGLNRFKKNIFLDIACFFKGYGREKATKILDCCYDGKSARSAITKLVDRCLLEILIDDDNFMVIYEVGDDNTLWMHDSIQEMGWEIVHQESEDPRKRSRLWGPEDIRLLDDVKVTDSVKAIYFDLDKIRINGHIQLCSAVFEKMSNLRFITFLSEAFDMREKLILKQDLKFLSEELCYLHWDCYPLKSLPSNFNPKNLVKLRLVFSVEIELLWGEDKDLVNLRVLHLFGCNSLRKLPNLSRSFKLEEIDCSLCESLVELPSLEHLASLKWLHLEECKSLTKLPELPVFLDDLNLNSTGIREMPDSIAHLQQLRNINLSGCDIIEIPELPRNISSLNLKGTGIEEMPPSISRLDKLEYLDVSFTKIGNLPRSIVELHALKVVRLRCLNVTIFPNFPEGVEDIDMSGSSIREIPSSISRLKCLKKLNLTSCERLKSLHELPPFIQRIDARGCASIQTVSFSDPDHYTFCAENASHWIEIDSFKLNGDAVHNIVTNALLKIHCIAKQLVEKLMVSLAKEQKEIEFEGEVYRTSRRGLRCFTAGGYEIDWGFKCTIPGLQVLELLEHPNWNSSIISSLIVELDPEKCSTNLLGFAFGFLYDDNEMLGGYKHLLCKWQLKTTSGDCQTFMFCTVMGLTTDNGYCVTILFDPRTMVHEPMPYVEASFQFVSGYDRHFKRNESYDLKVKKYGVHVFYIDADRRGDERGGQYLKEF